MLPIGAYLHLHFQLVILLKLFKTFKTYGHSNISISKPLELSFRKALITGTYLSDWKKSNNAPVYKNAINRLLRITTQFLRYRYVPKVLKRFYLIIVFSQKKLVWFFKQQEQWSNFFLGNCYCKSSSRVYLRSSVICNLYK